MVCRMISRAAYRTRVAAGHSFFHAKRFRGVFGGISNVTSVGLWQTHYKWALTPEICRSGTPTSHDVTPVLRRSGNAYALASERIPHRPVTPAPLRRKNTHALIPDKSPHRPKAALALLQRWDARILAPTMSGAGVPVTLALLRMPDARNPSPASRSMLSMKSTTMSQMGDMRGQNLPHPAASPQHSPWH